MPTPTGEIGLNQVNTELGFSATSTITMNDTVVRTLAGVPGSGNTISMDNLRGKSNTPSPPPGGRVTIPFVLGSAQLSGLNLYDSRGPTYVAGQSDFVVTIQPGGILTSQDNLGALRVPNQLGPTDTVQINIQPGGFIIGCGGNGGAGVNDAAGQPGSAGGVALVIQRPTTINNLGTIAGGGGGGGAGGGTQGQFIVGSPKTGFFLQTFFCPGSGGGGGSGGVGGFGGPGAFSAASGGSITSSPTSTAGGVGGPARTYVDQASPPVNWYQGRGGAGGNLGGYGAPAGPQGVSLRNGAQWRGAGIGGTSVYIQGSPFVTWQNTGSRIGTAN